MPNYDRQLAFQILIPTDFPQDYKDAELHGALCRIGGTLLEGLEINEPYVIKVGKDTNIISNYPYREAEEITYKIYLMDVPVREVVIPKFDSVLSTRDFTARDGFRILWQNFKSFMVGATEKPDWREPPL